MDRCQSDVHSVAQYLCVSHLDRETWQPADVARRCEKDNLLISLQAVQGKSIENGPISKSCVAISYSWQGADLLFGIVFYQRRPDTKLAGQKQQTPDKDHKIDYQFLFCNKMQFAMYPAGNPICLRTYI